MGVFEELSTRSDDTTHRDWDATTKTGTIRMALIGLGNFSLNRTLPAIRSCEHVEPTVLVSSSTEKAERIANEQDVDTGITYEMFEQGAAVDEYDAVYIATPITTHERYAKTAAALGKHVLCEKPMAGDAEQARAMAAACEDHGVTLMIAYRSQFEPTIRRVRTLLGDGYIGDPVQLQSTFSSPIVKRHGPGQWRLSDDLAGGGPVINLGIYQINTIRFLLGENPASVTATTTAQGEGFSEVEEHAGYTLAFPSGAIAGCTTSYNSDRDNILRIVGTQGKIEIDPAYGVTTSHEVRVERDEWASTYETPAFNEITEEFEYFASCLLDDRDPEQDGNHGITDMEVIDAIYESAEQGQRISFSS
jgi:xylose dehydrogenase (NAD/NADP)